MSTEGIHVCVRVRPLNERELKNPNTTKGWVINSYDNTIQQDVAGKQPISFDRVFDEDADNAQVYRDAAKRVVDSVMDGINGTIFAYGQTSSGKTYSMSSIMNMGFQDIFAHIKKDKDRKYTVSASYIEIYNEAITDLLNPEEKNLKVQESERGPYIVNLLEHPVSSYEEVRMVYERGSSARQVGSTLMNDQSSRSHTILQLHISSEPVVRESISNQKHSTTGGASSGSGAGCSRGILKATLNLVDLAGSERANSTGAQGQRLKEGAHINKSLLTLGAVIRKLSDINGTNNGTVHIPFRNSKLTRILQPALGGNSRTTMLCCITQASIHYEETISTLGFARRAKLIKNKVGVNEILDDKALIKKLQSEIIKLKNKLAKSTFALAHIDDDNNSDTGTSSGTSSGSAGVVHTYATDMNIINAFKNLLPDNAEVDADCISPTKKLRLSMSSGENGADTEEGGAGADNAANMLVTLQKENGMLKQRLQQMAAISSFSTTDVDEITYKIAQSLANAEKTLHHVSQSSDGYFRNGRYTVEYGTQTRLYNTRTRTSAGSANNGNGNEMKDMFYHDDDEDHMHVHDDDDDDDDAEDRIVIPRKHVVAKALLNIDMDSDDDSYDAELDAFFARPSTSTSSTATTKPRDGEDGSEETKQAFEEDAVDADHDATTSTSTIADVDTVIGLENIPILKKDQLEQDIQTYHIMNSKNLRKHVQNLVTRIYELDSKCSFLQEDCDMNKDILEEEVQVRKYMVNELYEELDHVYDMYSQMNDNIVEYIANMKQQYITKIQTLEEEHKDAQDMVARVQKEKEHLQELVLKLKEDLEEATEEYLQNHNNKELLDQERNDRVKQLEKECMEQLTTVNTLQSTITDLKSVVESLRTEIACKEETMAALEMDKQANAKLLEQIKYDSQEHVDKVHELEAAMVELRKKASETTFALERANMSKAELEDQISKLQTELEQQQQEHRAKIDKMQEEANAREEEFMQELAQYAQDMQEKEAKHKERIAEYKDQVRTLEDQLEQLQTSLDANIELHNAAEIGRLEQQIVDIRAQYEKIIETNRVAHSELVDKYTSLEVETQQERLQFFKTEKQLKEEKQEYSLLCEELEERLVKERAKRTELEKQCETFRIEAASIKAVLEEVRNSHVKDEEVIERRIQALIADKDRHIESLERRILAQDDKSYREQKMRQELQSEINSLHSEIATLKDQMATLRQSKDDMDNYLASVQEEHVNELEEMKRMHKKQLHEVQTQVEATKMALIQEKEEMLAQKLEQMREAEKLAYNVYEKELLQKIEIEVENNRSLQADLYALENDYNSYKRTVDIELKKRMTAQKQEWQKQLTESLKLEATRTEQQIQLNAALKQQIDTLEEKLQSAQKMLQNKDDNLQAKMQSYQETVEAYMTDKIQKLKLQLKRATNSLKESHDNEMQVTSELEKLRSDFERQKIKMNSLQEEVRMKNVELDQKSAMLARLEQQIRRDAHATMSRVSQSHYTGGNSGSGSGSGSSSSSSSSSSRHRSSSGVDGEEDDDQTEDVMERRTRSGTVRTTSTSTSTGTLRSSRRLAGASANAGTGSGSSNSTMEMSPLKPLSSSRLNSIAGNTAMGAGSSTTSATNTTGIRSIIKNSSASDTVEKTPIVAQPTVTAYRYQRSRRNEEDKTLALGDLLK